MFQFPPFAFLRYFTYVGIIKLSLYGVPPFGNARFNAWYAARRAFSEQSSVLHRHHIPRHPPRALSRFATSYSSPILRSLKLIVLVTP
jgi:hypothetical protein